MPVGEVIGGFIGDIIAQVFFEWFLGGLGRLIRGSYYWLRKLITGKKRKSPELKRLEKLYLNKKFRILHNIDERVPRRTRGTVLEVIDKQYFLVEFEDAKGKPILVNDKKAVKIKRSIVVLERKRRAQNKN